MLQHATIIHWNFPKLTRVKKHQFMIVLLQRQQTTINVYNRSIKVKFTPPFPNGLLFTTRATHVLFDASDNTAVHTHLNKAGMKLTPKSHRAGPPGTRQFAAGRPVNINPVPHDYRKSCAVFTFTQGFFDWQLTRRTTPTILCRVYKTEVVNGSCTKYTVLIVCRLKWFLLSESKYCFSIPQDTVLPQLP